VPSQVWYDRFEDSLERWKMVGVRFEGKLETAPGCNLSKPDTWLKPFLAHSCCVGSAKADTEERSHRF